MSTIPADRHQVKAKFLFECERFFDRLLGRAEHPDGDVVADLEQLAGAGSAQLGRDLLTTSLARTCEAAMERDIEGRGLDKTQIRLRMEKDYFAALSTTLGLIVFPWFAYRCPMGDVLGRAFVTRNPARALLPYYRKCPSSPVCLEWEARLGARDAFRKAQEMLNFVTRGALKLEDTTIERHMIAAARLIDPSWLYRNPADIRSILAERATRDLQTGRPLIYASTDGHALRRYVGDTWAWGWMVVNGIRLWCEDAKTGRIIHIGGEFTWGDCRCVASRFSKLLELGILPNDEPEWKSIDAQLVFLSDGAEWIVEHVLPVFRDTFVILDPFHVVGWFAGLGAQLLPRLRKCSPDATSKALLNLLAIAAEACDHLGPGRGNHQDHEPSHQQCSSDEVPYLSQARLPGRIGRHGVAPPKREPDPPQAFRTMAGGDVAGRPELPDAGTQWALGGVLAPARLARPAAASLRWRAAGG